MKKILVNILCAFIPGRLARKKIRKKYLEDKAKSNTSKQPSLPPHTTLAKIGAELVFEGRQKFFAVYDAAVGFESWLPAAIKNGKIITDQFNAVHAGDIERNLKRVSGALGGCLKKLDKTPPPEAAYLTTPWSYPNNNCWHAMFEDAATIAELEALGYRGKYIMPEHKPGFMKELYTLLVGADRIIEIKREQRIEVGRLIMADSPRYARGPKTPGEYIMPVRDRILAGVPGLVDAGYPKRVYLSRVCTRKLTNEAELLDILRPLGFKRVVMEEHSFAEQVRYFHNADIVIAPHGAGSANAIFMRPGATFLELFPFTFGERCIWNALNVLGVKYLELVEEPNMRALDRDLILERDYYTRRDYAIAPERVKILV
ncbi:MAG: glycosyltransferase family 61 protein [Alphaproteobacteria bacterium]|nr:glycosyltransferase family 61 protein [Alphaproteobacteria bacterium]